MKTFDLSVIIPIYNRGDMIKYTLESVKRASQNLAVEIIVIDDGSAIPVAESLNRLGYTATQLRRQDNRGLLFARLAGLEIASGRYVQFLDSDDLVSHDKFSAQISRMEGCNADVSYVDTAKTELTGDFDHLNVLPDSALHATDDPGEFYIDIQPAPHSPIFRRDYLMKIVRNANFPPTPLYNPVAEIWFYHVAASRPAKVVHVPGPRAIIGCHPNTRLTNNWERLGVASLAVMEAFARTTPNAPETSHARELVARKAFKSWRILPRGFSPEFAERLLNIWRRLHSCAGFAGLGGVRFQVIARLLGPVAAGVVLRYWHSTPYEQCRTLSDEDLESLLKTLPRP